MFARELFRVEGRDCTRDHERASMHLHEQFPQTWDVLCRENPPNPSCQFVVCVRRGFIAGRMFASVSHLVHLRFPAGPTPSN